MARAAESGGKPVELGLRYRTSSRIQRELVPYKAGKGIGRDHATGLAQSLFQVGGNIGSSLGPILAVRGTEQ